LQTCFLLSAPNTLVGPPDIQSSVCFVYRTLFPFHHPKSSNVLLPAPNTLFGPPDIQSSMCFVNHYPFCVSPPSRILDAKLNRWSPSRLLLQTCFLLSAPNTLVGPPDIQSIVFLFIAPSFRLAPRKPRRQTDQMEPIAPFLQTFRCPRRTRSLGHPIYNPVCFCLSLLFFCFTPPRNPRRQTDQMEPIAFFLANVLCCPRRTRLT
jgi:predicted small secreted protein